MTVESGPLVVEWARVSVEWLAGLEEENGSSGASWWNRRLLNKIRRRRQRARARLLHSQVLDSAWRLQRRRPRTRQGSRLGCWPQWLRGNVRRRCRRHDWRVEVFVYRLESARKFIS